MVYVSMTVWGYRAMVCTASVNPEDAKQETHGAAQPVPPQSVTPLPDEVIAEIDPALAYWLRSRL